MSEIAPCPSTAAAAAAAVGRRRRVGLRVLGRRRRLGLRVLVVVILVVLLGAAALAFVILAPVIFVLVFVKGAALAAVTVVQIGEHSGEACPAREATVALRADAVHPVAKIMWGYIEGRVHHVRVPAKAIASITQRTIEDRHGSCGIEICWAEGSDLPAEGQNGCGVFCVVLCD